MAPQLVMMFWGDVENLLVQQFRFGRPEASQAIDEYRREVEINVGEAIYNRGTDQVARTIAESVHAR